MKIYFAGSIRGGRQDAKLYLRIIKQLQEYGTVLTEHVGAKDLDEYLKMKIYFAGSIRGGRQDAELYLRIIEQLQEYGTVLTEHVGAKDLEECNEHMSEQEIHERDMAWINDCDVLVAEVTQPSLGVGYEIGRAIASNKRILCLFRPDSGKSLSAMIVGADNGSPSFVVKRYKEEDVPSILKEFLN